MAFQIIRNDITKVTADAIVNSANPEPIYAAGTDKAIYDAAGADELLEERKKIGVIETGQAVVTPAFALDAKYIIHTVGPAWWDGQHGEKDAVRACYENSFGDCNENATLRAMAVILKDCTEYERKILSDNMKSLKLILRDNTRL